MHVEDFDIREASLTMDKEVRSAKGSRTGRVARSPKGERTLRPVGAFECKVHRRPPPVPQMSEELAVELYAILAAALTRLGMSPADQDRAISRARELDAPPRVSGPMLRDLRGLSEMLCAWSEEPDYLDPAGRPRVLAISGPGATLERLAKRFLPGVALADVLAMLDVHTEVALRPGNRIALLGGVLVNFARSPDLVLAQGVRQIDQLLGTLLHNVATAKDGAGEGRIERMLLGIITRAEADDLMPELRSHIGACLARIQSDMKSRRPRADQSLKDVTAISVGVYVSRDDDWERMGVNAAAFVKAPLQETDRS